MYKKIKVADTNRSLILNYWNTRYFWTAYCSKKKTTCLCPRVTNMKGTDLSHSEILFNWLSRLILPTLISTKDHLSNVNPTPKWNCSSNEVTSNFPPISPYLQPYFQLWETHSLFLKKHTLLPPLLPLSKSKFTDKW